MKFHTFYLFYLLTILLLLLGFLTSDTEIVVASWHTTIIKGMWLFFIPAAIGSLLTGLIYHYWFNSGRVVYKGTVLLHIILVVLGLCFSFNIYRAITFLLGPAAPDTIAFGGDYTFLLIFSGPVLLMASLVVFVIGLVKAKRN